MNDDECIWCREYKVFKRRGGCEAVEPERGYSCTRYSGHGGYHVACGVEDDEHPIITWRSDKGNFFNEK